MSRYLRMMLFLAVVALPGVSSALEIVAPTNGCTVPEGRVVLIGLAPKTEGGKVDIGGRSTSFRVKDGVFSLGMNLSGGAQELTITAGKDKLVLKLNVDGSAKKGVYRYHPEVAKEKCKSCHAEGEKLTRESDLTKLCFTCHKMTEKQFSHGPYAMGMCAACHDPHGSVNEKNLRLPVFELCNDCHNQPVSEKHKKNAGDDLCTDCHSPHTAGKQFMIR